MPPPWTSPTIGSQPVALLGAGVLGRRIACVFASAGYNVHLRDPSSDARSAALDYISKNLDDYSNMSKGDRVSGQYRAFADLDSAVRDAWLVIEAVPAKIDTMGEADQKAPADCILASNSSSFKSRLMLDKIRAQRRPLVCNVHFAMPPEVRNVLEDCGMLPVTARKESTGFIFNRLWAAVKCEIMTILAEGISEPKEIDKLWLNMFNSKNPGPCALMDQVGLDTVTFIEDNYAQERHLDTALTVDWLRYNHVAQGKLGAKAPKDIALANCSGQILRRTGNDKQATAVVSGLKCPDSIDFSLSTGRMFWTNMGLKTSTCDGSVMSANLDGSDVQTLIPEGSVHTPKQLVVEDKNRKIYFCDREGLGVHRCDFNGQNHEILVLRGDCNIADQEDQPRWCVGIAVDTKHGKFYWTQKGPSKGNVGCIFRANIDMPAGESSSNRSDIECLLKDLPEPVDLDIEPETRMFYWTDRGEHPTGNTLNRACVGDQKPHAQILARHFHEPIGLNIDSTHQHIYVSDLGGTLYRFGIDGSDRTVVQSDDGCYTGIALV
ncbi:hypothetical protein QBC33DRAFT_578263 [Phialemonium atrogriseum]|uniref:3-hydroxyacyl-CoA dehydrogenase n=1 Tax=Phialemonium atrogriseum TaxID=1093897 RepID=A0AAJ0BZQ8_9PEZI|nr:uncharacterized protein QBC33DRAFT_578263 [Phialemonium atrogriseum]KAK1767513.1 hypothetical protein QBC33DRAFT_578263 [Phialemonium atrogriseum]